MKRAFPILAVLTALLLSYAFYEALIVAPTEQTMGNVQRIFYYHVPSALDGIPSVFHQFRCVVVYLIRPQCESRHRRTGQPLKWESFSAPWSLSLGRSGRGRSGEFGGPGICA